MPLEDTNQESTIRQRHTINAVLPEGNIQEILNFIHKALFSPRQSTLLKAITQGNLATWPLLTKENVQKYLPNTEASALGHLDQQRKNIQSTKVQAPNKDEEQDKHIKTNVIFPSIMELPHSTGKIATDQTGRFPTTSSRGNTYVFLLYDYDSNAILAEPIKSRSQQEILRAYKTLFLLLKQRGLTPKLQRLDNEASTLLKNEMTDAGVSWQLVPPHIHRGNAAERAIRTWKNHFIAGLASTDPNFPIHLWDRLIPQATTTLYLLRSSRINPRLSSEAQLNGQFDYNRTPLAPPGTRVIIHDKPSARATWAPHGSKGWYIGAAPNHYRCWTVYVDKTASERIGDTVEFFPKQCAMPKLSSADLATKAAIELLNALKNPTPAAPFAPINAATMEAIKQVANIFQQQIAPTRNPTTVPRPNQPPAEPRQASPRVANSQPPPRVTNEQWVTKEHLPHLHPPVQPPQRVTDEQWVTQVQHYVNAVLDPITGQHLEYRHLIRNPQTKLLWEQSASNEFGRLMTGLKRGNILGTKTMRFIHRNEIPQGRTITYAKFVCDYKPQKQEQERTRITVGGDRIEYPGEVATRSADITTIKCLLNSVISTKNARFGTADVKNFYLNTPMLRAEYMKIHMNFIPKEIQEEYNIADKIIDNHVYVEINKGMYGLPQAGILANKLLSKRLAKYEFHQTDHTPGLWTHKTRSIKFALVVDDFGFQYNNKQDADYLIMALRNDYKDVTVDWTGARFCGVNIAWDYQNKHVDISMPGYIEKVLHRFQHQAKHED